MSPQRSSSPNLHAKRVQGSDSLQNIQVNVNHRERPMTALRPTIQTKDMLMDPTILNIAIPVSRAEPACKKDGCLVKETGGTLQQLVGTLHQAQQRQKRPFSSMTRKKPQLQSICDPIEQITRDKNFLKFY